MTVDLDARLRSAAAALDTAAQQYALEESYVAHDAPHSRRAGVVAACVLVAASIVTIALAMSHRPSSITPRAETTSQPTMEPITGFGASCFVPTNLSSDWNLSLQQSLMSLRWSVKPYESAAHLPAAPATTVPGADQRASFGEAPSSIPPARLFVNVFDDGGTRLTISATTGLGPIVLPDNAAAALVGTSGNNPTSDLTNVYRVANTPLATAVEVVAAGRIVYDIRSEIDVTTDSASSPSRKPRSIEDLTKLALEVSQPGWIPSAPELTAADYNKACPVTSTATAASLPRELTSNP
jgi:hypothetical protein